MALLQGVAFFASTEISCFSVIFEIALSPVHFIIDIAVENVSVVDFIAIIVLVCEWIVAQLTAVFVSFSCCVFDVVRIID